MNIYSLPCPWCNHRIYIPISDSEQVGATICDKCHHPVKVTVTIVAEKLNTIKGV